MGRLIVTGFMALDGVAQAPGGPAEDRDGGFVHGGWQAPVADPESGEVIFGQAGSMDALLLGRRTYEIFAAFWPSAPQEIPFTGLRNGVPKYVASRTLAGSLAWQGPTLLAGDLAEHIATVKDRHDEVHVIGSLDLVQSLLRLRLVDRMNLWVYPLLLGSGERVFADGTVPTALHLTESVTYPSGTVHLTYETAGVPTYGAIASEEWVSPPLAGGDRIACRTMGDQVTVPGQTVAYPRSRGCGVVGVRVVAELPVWSDEVVVNSAEASP
jgi:dihydrofolate reductase